jgi:hypothetical protein
LKTSVLIEKNNNLLEKQSSRPAPSIPHPSRNKSNHKIGASIPLTAGVTLPDSKVTPPTSKLSLQKTSIVKNAGINSYYSL